MRIMSNIPALQSYNALTATNSALSKSIERLSTGLRINSAADDAAGLAISEKMRAQIRGLNQATANAQDGISMIQTAEGALSETHSILQRMRELSVQAANDTLTQEDRSYIQLEIDELKEEVSRIATTTQFNKKKLLDGSAAVLWSSDNLATKAIVKGGLRQIDQFGQKSALEGNFKITVSAQPGQGEVQKSDIFKIKHKNVIMDLQIDVNNGFQKIEVDNLPAGQYTVTQATAAGLQTQTYVTNVPGADVAATTTLATYGTIGVLGNADDPTSLVQLTTNTDLWINGAFKASGSVIDLGALGAAGAAGAANAADATGAMAAWAVAINGGYTDETDVTIGDITSITKVQLNAPTTVTAHYATANFKIESVYGIPANSLTIDAKSIDNKNNASILLEVVNVNPDAKVVTFRAQVNTMDITGEITTYVDENFQVTTAGVAVGQSKIGMYFYNQSAITLNASTLAQFDKGDKMVLNFLANMTAATNTIAVSASIDPTWPNSWKNADGTPATVEVSYNVNADALQDKSVHFKNFYLNTANGVVFEGDVKILFNEDMKTLTAGSQVRASFQAAYIGQVAKGDAKLRDLDKFWDANGKFMLDDPQTLTIYQGDGKNTSITLYSTDTLDDVRKKLNDAVAYGLNQSKYVVDASNKFVSFVTDPTLTSDESVAGTFVIRSLIPGSAGTLSFSGDEDIIKAFSLNVIQQPKENAFTVSVFDAHTGAMVATNLKIAGNTLYGVVNPNVDVEFDPMANIEASWNELTKSFVLTKETTEYSTIIHLADNTTVFQVGANEGEDIGIDMGDMSAHALGIDRIVVTDRESAARSITVLDTAIGRVSRQRAKLGAYQNRLEHTISNLTTASTNTTAAESRIRDADMAKEMMEFTKLNILSQAGTSMLAQANQLPQNVLSLLRG